MNKSAESWGEDTAYDQRECTMAELLDIAGHYGYTSKSDGLLHADYDADETFAHFKIGYDLGVAILNTPPVWD